jgi:predicted membrane-bound spermidine synthase
MPPPPAASPLKRPLLYYAALVSGFVTMALEMLIGRTLIPYFGGTIYTWGALISVFLAGMSLGYAGAGRVADRHPKPMIIAALFLLTGLYMAVPSLLGDWILNRILDHIDDMRLAALAGALALALVPAGLMAGVSPFCMRLLLDDAYNVGKISGRISAVVTIGSIAGALSTSFLLIPTLGVQSIYIGLGVLVGVSAILTLAVSLTSRAPTQMASAAAIVVAALAAGPFFAATPARADTTLQTVDSEYNTIIIAKSGSQIAMDFGYRNLRYEESAMDLAHPNDLIVPYTQVMTAAVAYPTGPVRNIALVGLGGGRTIIYLAQSMPTVRIDVGELDPQVIRLAAKYFGVGGTDRVRIINNDGRVFLRTQPPGYDVIMLDAYRGPFVPFHLTTKEFYQLVKTRLRPGGVAVQNIDPTTLLFDSTLATMRTVFANVDVYQASGNVVLVGYDGPKLTDAQLAARAAGRQAQYHFRYDLTALVRTRNSAVPANPHATVLTDNFAPVEMLNTIKRNNARWR